jgi:O-methyltransferase
MRFFKKVLESIFRALGFNIYIRKIPTEGFLYQPVFPAASYSPWLGDRAFLDTYAIIKQNTLVDQYRCFELWELVGQVKKLSGAIIEIGVWQGGTGGLISKKATLEGINSNVYLCDTFEGVVKTGENDTVYVGGEHSDTSQQIVEKLLGTLGTKNVKILKGIFPDDTEQLVVDSDFRLCHIDVDVYQSAKDILEWVWPKLVRGGIVVFDDFGFETCVGIAQLINEEKTKNDRTIIQNLNGHAIIVKL